MRLICVWLFFKKKDILHRFGFWLTALLAGNFFLFHCKFSYNTENFFLRKVLNTPSVSKIHLKYNFLVWLVVLRSVTSQLRWLLRGCVCTASLAPSLLFCQNFGGLSGLHPCAVGNSTRLWGERGELPARPRVRRRRRGTPASAGGEPIPSWFNGI